MCIEKGEYIFPFHIFLSCSTSFKKQITGRHVESHCFKYFTAELDVVLTLEIIIFLSLSLFFEGTKSAVLDYQMMDIARAYIISFVR